MWDKKIKTLILQKTLQSQYKLSFCFSWIQFVITSSVLMQSMCYCQNKTVIKQLLNGFQQHRINTLTNMAAIGMGWAAVPLKCFLFCDVRQVHFRTTGQWIHGYIVYMFSEKCRSRIWCNSSYEQFSNWNHRSVTVHAYWGILYSTRETATCLDTGIPHWEAHPLWTVPAYVGRLTQCIVYSLQNCCKFGASIENGGPDYWCINALFGLDELIHLTDYPVVGTE